LNVEILKKNINKKTCKKKDSNKKNKDKIWLKKTQANEILKKNNLKNDPKQKKNGDKKIEIKFEKLKNHKEWNWKRFVIW
jgi:hypothetical protein